MLQRSHTHTSKTHPNYSTLNVFFITNDREFIAVKYFNIPNKHWKQLDMFEEHASKCPDDALYYKKLVDHKRWYKFLIGLNKNLIEYVEKTFQKDQSLVFEKHLLKWDVRKSHEWCWESKIHPTILRHLPWLLWEECPHPTT